MSGHADLATSAGLSARNNALDLQLRELARQVTDERLRADPGDGEWTLAENLAHIGEFPRFFAREITAMVSAAGDVEVGRTHEHPERREAIAAAEGKSRNQLIEAVGTAIEEMAEAVGQVTDDDLHRAFTNRKYGKEPLTAYLERYVLGHKAAHVDQLRRTLGAVTG